MDRGVPLAAAELRISVITWFGKSSPERLLHEILEPTLNVLVCDGLFFFLVLLVCREKKNILKLVLYFSQLLFYEDQILGINPAVLIKKLFEQL